MRHLVRREDEARKREVELGKEGEKVHTQAKGIERKRDEMGKGN